jgi:predicted transcriptional regulator
MLAVLTPARLALFKVIKQKPGSSASIAQKMKRDRSAVTRDVAALGRAAWLHYGKTPSGSRTDERSARPR